MKRSSVQYAEADLRPTRLLEARSRKDSSSSFDEEGKKEENDNGGAFPRS